jgi:hypothetical protein
VSARTPASSGGLAPDREFPEGVEVTITGSAAQATPRVRVDGALLGWRSESVHGADVLVSLGGPTSYVAVNCGPTQWLFSSWPGAAAADAAAVLAVAEALIPHLYCTVGEVPLEPGLDPLRPRT